MFRNADDGRLAMEVYASIGVLVDELQGNNPWGISVQRMLSLSDPGDLFRRTDELDQADRGHDKWQRLMSGKAIYQFDHRYATWGPSGWSRTTISERSDPNFQIETEYRTIAEEVSSRIKDKYPNRWLLGYRDITNATNERTVISTILPVAGCDTTCRNIYFQHLRADLIILFLANLNSFIFDFFARQKVIGTHLNASTFAELPALSPDHYHGILDWDLESRVDDWLRARAFELAFASWELVPFARDIGFTGAPYLWDAQRRYMLQSELDAAFFRLYGIARPDVEYIMETFPIVKRHDEQEHGEYRTKRTILGIFDEMQQAIETGEPYQSHLDPLPADPTIAHRLPDIERDSSDS